MRMVRWRSRLGLCVSVLDAFMGVVSLTQHRVLLGEGDLE